MPSFVDRDQEIRADREIRAAALVLVTNVANKYGLKSMSEFKCPDMRRLAESVGLVFKAQEPSAPGKPFVRDGRWIAEVGNKFKYLGVAAFGQNEIVTVLEATRGGDTRVQTQRGPTRTRLLHCNWELVPVRKPYIKNGQWIAEVGDKFKWIGATKWADVSTTAIVKEVDVARWGNSYRLVDDLGRDQERGWLLLTNNWEPVS